MLKLAYNEHYKSWWSLGKVKLVTNVNITSANVASQIGQAIDIDHWNNHRTLLPDTGKHIPITIKKLEL